jgi:hypothetical protein
MKRTRPYFTNILVGLDQFVGTLFGIDADETISSYCGRTKMGRWQQRLIDWIFLQLTGEQDHCLNNIEKQFLGDK